MADSVVGFLVQRLSQLLESEIKLLSGVEEKIKSLRNELKFMDIFIKSSEGKYKDAVVKEVVTQIRDVAHKAEDVVDTYILNIAKHKRRNKLCRLFHLKEKLVVPHEVDAEIEKIRSRIDEIYKNQERYGIKEGEFQSEEAVAIEWRRKRRMDVEEEDVVGLVNESDTVIQQLQKDDVRLNVASIVGMGGLGKTTLARKIYNKDVVKNIFPCRAWGNVSNDYRPKEVFQSLLSCLNLSGFENLSEENLKKEVAKGLKGKKYLIVLDDIWETRVWDDIKGAFPDDNTGSRVLITSREMHVARHAGTTSPYELPFLTEDKSWELFFKKVFRGEKCPSELEPLGRSIVKETCGGLPLAIVILGGLFAKKEKSQREWSRMKKMSWNSTADKNEVMDILRLSYDNLPPTLKPCFLYFGIYPEDHKISAREVIQLWGAEGFVQPQENAEPEEVGDFYLDELVDRSLVQVTERRTDGGVKICQVHDVLRDFCISESKFCKFMDVYRESNIDTLSDTNPRRLSLLCQPQSSISVMTFDKSMSSTRSVFVFTEASKSVDDLVKRFMLARVIHGFQPSLFPDNLKRMIHLRYLKILFVDSLPACVGNLWNLETLDVSYKKRVSSKIWKLKRLRRLCLRGRGKLPVLPKGTRMENLQSLWLYGWSSEIKSLVDNGIFPRLVKLALSPMTLLRIDEDEEVDFLSGVQCLNHLGSLKIDEIGNLPSDNNVFPSKITKITFKQILSWSFMKTLGQLPNLQILKLEYESGILRNLDIGKGEFCQLQVFHIKFLSIKSWRLEESAMPRLRHLRIINCYYLFQLPQQLWSLRTLQLVHIVRPSQELTSNLQIVEFKNNCKLVLEDMW
ncbi:putative disease resistance RPP13-like protein 3 [Vigna radiata var. radiata]|uniref:Disease resistance RPP13-like protein 3 n=1 Tax=Vigna radiata var. radiata TaxID=3916 RepID=A0A1S3TT27_VIGRR|nr:putative disease resistance RPP13-like protein 3 [Vigna radiata var. radiata]XP_022635793.1 putative disease resistance RPP13-like protein 3 [Vigna radiata var. radiata]